jgi:hypothetical protein
MRSEVVGKKEELTLAHTSHKSTCAPYIRYRSLNPPATASKTQTISKPLFAPATATTAGSGYLLRCRHSLAILYTASDPAFHFTTSAQDNNNGTQTGGPHIHTSTTPRFQNVMCSGWWIRTWIAWVCRWKAGGMGDTRSATPSCGWGGGSARSFPSPPRQSAWGAQRMGIHVLFFFKPPCPSRTHICSRQVGRLKITRL